MKRIIAIAFTTLLLLSLSIGILAESPDAEYCPVTGGPHNYNEQGGIIYCMDCDEYLGVLFCPPHFWQEIGPGGMQQCEICGVIW